MAKTSDGGDALVRRVGGQARRSSESLKSEIGVLKEAAAALERNQARLEEELASTRAELERQRRERARLEDALARAESEKREVSAEFVDGERSQANLASLYVATDRLHASLDREEVLLAIQEIITNLIGCEELAVFELDRAGSSLVLATSMGIDAARFTKIPAGEGIFGSVIRTGEPYIAAPDLAPDEGAPANLTACVPLKLHGRVTGAIAIFRLLLQKSGLTAVDRELLSLLGPHAALALYCCALHARVGHELLEGLA